MTTRIMRNWIAACGLAATVALGCRAERTAGVEPVPRDAAPAPNAHAQLAADHEQPTGAPRTLTEDDLKGLSWRSIGPANMGGRVSDFAVAPGNPKTYFVAFGTGGLWKTTNNGVTFSPVFDDKDTSSIGTVAVADAPSDWSGWAEEKEKSNASDDDSSNEKDRGKAKIVWVGTGEGNGRNSSSWGHGVYVSTDGGGSFKYVGLKETHDIPQLEVDPRNPDVCYVAAMGHLWGPNEDRGVYKTTDRGKTWQKILYVNDTTGCCDVRVDPNNPDIVYAAMYTRQRRKWSFLGTSTDGGIFRSKDGGATWTKLTNNLPNKTGRIGLDIYLKDPRIIYAAIESDAGGRIENAWHNESKEGGIFRSEDHGDTWTRMSNFAPRPFYFSRIRIDPNNDQRIYKPGWGLSASDDGGKTFLHGLASIVHVDFHAMWIDPADSDHLMIGNDGGFYVSYDKGKNWDFHNDLAVGEFYNIAVDNTDPYRVAGGLQDNGSWIGPSESLRQTSGDEMGEGGNAITNADWSFFVGGDGFHVAFDPVDSNIVYGESQGGELSRVNVRTGERKNLHPASREGEPKFRFNWNAPFFISPHDPTVLYLGGNVVFKLTERGDRWTKISGDLTTQELAKMVAEGSVAEQYGTIVSLAESPLAKGMIWAGTDDGLIHVTTDDGATWNNVTPAVVDGRYISKIEPSHHDKDRAFAAVDGHRSDRMEPLVLMTNDGGTSWIDVTGNLPQTAPVKVIREDLRNENVLYCGTEHAAYVSIDRGKHWIKLNGKSLPTVAVDDLALQPHEYDLVAGTHGRSIYILDDASPLSQLTPEVLASKLHLFDIPDGQPRIYMPYGGLWSNRMFKAKNKPMGARISYWVGQYTGDDVSISITDPHGNTIRKLSGSNRPGINRVVWDLQVDKKQRDRGAIGQDIFVEPGEYKVSISMGDAKDKGTVKVLPSPLDQH